MINLKSHKTDIYDNIPVGQSRIDYENSIGIISHNIADVYKGNGLADRMLGLVEKSVKEERKEIEILRAKCKV